MTIIYHDEAMPERYRGAIAALGNFDGFHRGHQAVAGRAMEIARERGVPTIIATFDPHPALYFNPDLAPHYLTTLDQRSDLFRQAGADATLVFRFSDAFAKISADAFIADMLAGKLGLGGVVTGEDISFGSGRAGDAALLKSLGAQSGLVIEAVPPVLSDGEVISSSRIRRALREGRPEDATRLLTRPFAIRGEVMHGAKEGRRLGFPTANIEMRDYLRPLYGIYAVKGRMPDGRMIDGVANVGIRPSYEPPIELLEAHFFDFDEDIYGQVIEVEFHYFLRPEAKFDDLDELSRQIDKDCRDAADLLSR